MLDINYFPEDQFLLADRMLERSVFQLFWNQGVIYHCGGREATILVLIFFVLSCTLSLEHCQWEKLFSHCYSQKAGHFLAMMSPSIFLCVMNQAGTANHRLHKTAVWKILPVIVYLLFCLGKADVLLSLQRDCTADPDLHLKMQCTRVEGGICLVMHILRGRSPSAEAFSRQRKCNRAEGQEVSKS